MSIIFENTGKGGQIFSRNQQHIAKTGTINISYFRKNGRSFFRFYPLSPPKAITAPTQTSVSQCHLCCVHCSRNFSPCSLASSDLVNSSFLYCCKLVAERQGMTQIFKIKQHKHQQSTYSSADTYRQNCVRICFFAGHKAPFPESPL